MEPNSKDYGLYYDPPYGYRWVRFGLPKRGERLLDASGKIQEASLDFRTIYVWIVEKYKVTTFCDLCGNTVFSEKITLEPVTICTDCAQLDFDMRRETYKNEKWYVYK